MKISLDELIEHSFCIACNNADYERFAEDFKKKLGVYKAPRMFRGFVFNVGFYPALGIWTDKKESRKDFGCSLTHSRIIQMAKALDWPYVCIFEDDARLVSTEKWRFLGILNAIPDDINILRFSSTRQLSRDHELHKMAYDVTRSGQVCDPKTGFLQLRELRYTASAYCVFNIAYDVSLELTDRYNPLSDNVALHGCYARPYTGSLLFSYVDSFDVSGRKSYYNYRDITVTSRDSQERKFCKRPLVCTDGTVSELAEVVLPVYMPWIRPYDNTKSVRTYAAGLVISLLTLVKWAEAFGHSSVKYITSRGTYVVDAKDYEKVQDLSDYNLQGVEDLKGVRKE